MRCPSCGSRVGRGAARCPSCGASLDSKTASFGGAARAVRSSWGLEAREEAAVDRSRPRPRWAPLALGAGAAAAAALALAVGVLIRGQSPAGTPLTSESFPDEAFLEVAMSYDTDGDGALSEEEAARVTDLDLADRRLSSLEGVEAFKALAVLDASGNSLASADLSGLDCLVSVDLSGNSISELDLSGHAMLEDLDVSGNSMTALTLSGCSSLQSLSCAGNEIARLDLGGCPALSSLDCDPGQNATLPLSAGFFPDAALRETLSQADADGDGALTQRERSAVSSLSLAGSDVQSLKGLAWFDGLEGLDASGSSLSGIEEGDLPASLRSLDASGAAVASAGLSSLSRLERLDLSDNPLASLDVSGCARLASLDVSGCRLQGALDVSGCARLASLDATGNAGLESIDARGVAGLLQPGALLCDVGCSVLTSQETEAAAQATEQEAQETGQEAAQQPGPEGLGAQG